MPPTTSLLFFNPAFRSFAAASAQPPAGTPQTKILIKNLPKYWDANEIASRFGIIGNIQKVNLIKNSLGTNTGKAVV